MAEGRALARKRDFRLEYRKRKARAIVRVQEAKRGKPLSESYKKRITRSIIRTGGTLQHARGHKPREHIERAERERQLEGLTKAETKIVFWWAVKRSFLIHDDVTDPEELVQWAQIAGYEKFKRYRSKWEFVRRRYLKENKSGTYATRGMGFMEQLSEELEIPELYWLYYH